jgi:nucleotidyltransferase/DNA polymerase involved in DNA repair
MLAKLASSKNKPNKQTVVMPPGAMSMSQCVTRITIIVALLSDVPLQKIPKFGQKVNKKEYSDFLQDFKTVEALSRTFSETELQSKLGKDLGTWLFKACQGIDDSPVKPKGEFS